MLYRGPVAMAMAQGGNAFGFAVAVDLRKKINGEKNFRPPADESADRFKIYAWDLRSVFAEALAEHCPRFHSHLEMIRTLCEHIWAGRSIIFIGISPDYMFQTSCQGLLPFS